MENLIKLTVKTPNQRIDDIQIDCDLQWTVRKLKDYLQDVYPSNPESSSQKLIYLGRLLQDHLSLKEVFGEWGSQTLHLVCADSQCSKKDNENPQVQCGTMNNSSADGVRHRHTAANLSNSSVPPNTPSTSSFAATPTTMFQQYTETPLTLQQQQQYQQEMQQYMQQLYQWQLMMNYWGTPEMAAANLGQYGSTPATPSTPAPPSSQAPSTPPQPQQAQPQAVQNEPVQENQFQNVQMNAGPGPIQGDDGNDENLRNRDWLDWIYMSLRGLMLLSIIYFYSSTSRFLMVLMLGTILYLYKSGWFTPQRVHIPPEQPDPIRDANNDNTDGSASPNDVNSDDDGNISENSNNNSDNSDNNIHYDQPPRLGVLKMIWTFCTAFFGSLIPTPPPRPMEN